MTTKASRLAWGDFPPAFLVEGESEARLSSGEGYVVRGALWPSRAAWLEHQERIRQATDAIVTFFEACDERTARTEDIKHHFLYHHPHFRSRYSYGDAWHRLHKQGRLVSSVQRTPSGKRRWYWTLR